MARRRSPAAAPAPEPLDASANTLRTSTAATRVVFSTFGTLKAVSKGHRNEMADVVAADHHDVRAKKRVLNTKHPAFLACTTQRYAIEAYWKSVTYPYPDPGTRLIRRDMLGDFQSTMEASSAELARLVGVLDTHIGELRDEARQRLGRLFNPGDYPATMAGTFRVEWDYPNVEPPSYLLELHPDVYAAEQERAVARFGMAVQLAEEAFLHEFSQMIAHLCEKLSGTKDDGTPLIFRDSAVDNVKDFFERFKLLNIGSMPQLDALVSQAQDVLKGTTPQALRTDSDFRGTMAAKLSAVSSELEGMMTTRPRRNIRRPSTLKPEPEA